MKVIKMILGKSFLSSSKRYRVNSDICSRFVASLLDLHVSKEMVSNLARDAFKPSLLRGLEEVLQAAHLGEGIRRPQDLRRLQDPAIEYLPFLPDCVEASYWYHRFLVKTGYDSLKRLFQYVPVKDFQRVYNFDAFNAD